MSMAIKAYREPYETPHSWRTHRDYAARVARNRDPRGRWLVIGFDTNPGGGKRQSYSVVAMPDDFEELAIAMLKADPEAAIRAFGAALQGFELSSAD
jgi:hypothetical protein